MKITFERIRIDHDDGAVTVAMSPQEINRITDALWQLMHDAPGGTDFESLVGITPERVYALANELGEVAATIPREHDEP